VLGNLAEVGHMRSPWHECNLPGDNVRKPGWMPCGELFGAHSPQRADVRTTVA
jgi:hypothetical protein